MHDMRSHHVTRLLLYEIGADRSRYFAASEHGVGRLKALKDRPDEPSGQHSHWSQETSDALAALRTLLLNGGWARYWQERQVLPLLAS